MVRNKDTKEKPNKEYTVFDSDLMHQDIDCEKCSNFINTHIRLKRNAIIPSLKALAGHFRIDRVDSVGVHLLHLEAAGIAQITNSNGDPWIQGQSKRIKIDVSHYEFTKKMPEDQILMETDETLEMEDGTFITLKEANRRIKLLDWANGERWPLHGGLN